MLSASGDQKITVWNPDTGAKVRDIATGVYLYALVVSGSSVFCAGQSTLIKVYDYTTGGFVRQMTIAHTGDILSLFISGNDIYSSGTDMKVIRSQLSSGAQLGVFTGLDTGGCW